MATGRLPDEDGLVQFLDRDGHLREEATIPDLDADQLRHLYEQMRFARHLDERAISLHRQGRLGTYPPLAGQEAAQIASTMALEEDDWISYQYREHGAVIAREIGPAYLAYWMGHERGNEWLGDRSIFPLNISIGSQLPHATGLAWAAKLAGDDRVTLCHFGDGATSEGDVHEGLNFAGVFDVPAVFFCNNNQYAISHHRRSQTASATIAQKAHAYGFEGVRVDGMDPLAVYAVTREAVERARNPDAIGRTYGISGDEQVPGRARRPTLIEAVMYRLGAHTTVDDPESYRETAEVKRWRAYDPLPRFETFLRAQGLLDDDRRAAIVDRVEDSVASLIDEAEAIESDPNRLFEHVYDSKTPRIRSQQAALAELRDRHGDDALLRDE